MSFTMTDVPEKRVKCNCCAFDLSYMEFMFLDGKCVFCAEEGLTPLKTMSFWGYIQLLWHDYQVGKGKLRMKARGLTAIDFQACVSEEAPELHDITEDGLKRLTGHMRAHGRA